MTLDGLLHHRLIEHFLEHGHAPGLDALAASLGISGAELEGALRRLEAQHGVVLHGGPRPDVWLVHPFSSTPTLFWVEGAGRGWWAPCVWCALGVACLAEADVVVHTRVGGEIEAVRFEVRDGRVTPTDLVAHFSIPIARAWDDVHRFCSTALVFRTDAQARAWCHRHGCGVGAVVPIERVGQLATAWYGGHRAPAWRKHTQAEAKAIFERVGLTDAFWSLDAAAERF